MGKKKKRKMGRRGPNLDFLGMSKEEYQKLEAELLDFSPDEEFDFDPGVDGVPSFHIEIRTVR